MPQLPATIMPARTVCHARSAPTLRKESREGVGYSVVERNGVRHVFAAAMPRNGGDLREQTRDALRTISSAIHEQGVRGSIVHQAVFLRDLGQLDDCRQVIRDFYGPEMPATTYVPQPPCGGKLVEIEALGVGREDDAVTIQRYSEQMVVVEHGDVAWVHVANVRPETRACGIHDRSLDALRRMCDQLASRGFRYDQVVRTWLYLGDIVGPEGQTQRYKELNRARTEFYDDIPFGDGRVLNTLGQPIFPASTGIGTEGRDVTMGCIALATKRHDVLLVPLENPLQTPAFDYGTHYSPKSPKFARAMAVVAGGCATIFVSGTASITASETRYVGDIRGQTGQTLDNIAALISGDNLGRHGLRGFGATLDDMALVRVYVKRQEDYAAAREVCRARLGEVPTIFSIADVCRPELLVEIEGIAFTCRKGEWCDLGGNGERIRLDLGTSS
jgi:enamine deaminase RidA (YjgF/YER057c/UK114 family)